MTKNRDFKKLVRARMAKTGERYATARAHVLTTTTGPAGADGKSADGRLFESVRLIGGQQGDLAAAGNLCANAGVNGPDGAPLSEAMAFGLAGGVGFLYGVFEYGDTPTMTIVNRNKSMPDVFCAPLFDHLRLETAISETSGAKTAARQLDTAIESGTPALCTTASSLLPYLGPVCDDESAAAPHLVAVIGIDNGDDLLVDDRSPEPLTVSRSDFDRARAGNRKAKHRMITVARPDDHELDWPQVLAHAVAQGVAGYNTPPVPQFKSNIGLAGLTKWQELLTSGTKKGWGTIFGDGRRAAIGLTRLYDCVQNAYTAPSAGRPLYAEFLNEAATASPTSADADRWRASAQLWRHSGQRWAEVAARAADAHADIARYCELADQRTAELDTGSPDPDRMSEAAEEKTKLVTECRISTAEAAEAHGDIAALVADITKTETEALALLT